MIFGTCYYLEININHFADILSPILTTEPRLKQVEILSLQLYNFLASGPKVILKDKQVLEVSSGKGGGLASLTLLYKPKSSCGIDMCKENIEICQKRYYGI